MGTGADEGGMPSSAAQPPADDSDAATAQSDESAGRAEVVDVGVKFAMALDGDFSEVAGTPEAKLSFSAQV